MRNKYLLGTKMPIGTTDRTRNEHTCVAISGANTTASVSFWMDGFSLRGMIKERFVPLPICANTLQSSLSRFDIYPNPRCFRHHPACLSLDRSNAKSWHTKADGRKCHMRAGHCTKETGSHDKQATFYRRHWSRNWKDILLESRIHIVTFLAFTTNQVFGKAIVCVVHLWLIIDAALTTYIA